MCNVCSRSDDVRINYQYMRSDSYERSVISPRVTRTPSSSVLPQAMEDDEDGKWKPMLTTLIFLTPFLDLPVEYEPPEDETLESEDLVDLLDETDNDTTPAPDDIPIRYLDDFALYEQDTSEMIPFWTLALESDEQVISRGLVASGVVSPRRRKKESEWSDDEDESDEDEDAGFDMEDAPRVRLTGYHTM